jgi:hypothetical protein
MFRPFSCVIFRRTRILFSFWIVPLISIFLPNVHLQWASNAREIGNNFCTHKVQTSPRLSLWLDERWKVSNSRKSCLLTIVLLRLRISVDVYRWNYRLWLTSYNLDSCPRLAVRNCTHRYLRRLWSLCSLSLFHLLYFTCEFTCLYRPLLAQNLLWTLSFSWGVSCSCKGDIAENK